MKPLTATQLLAKRVKYQGIYMSPEMRDEIIALTPKDGFVADTLREALTLGLPKVHKARRRAQKSK